MRGPGASVPSWAKGPHTWGGGSSLTAHRQNTREIQAANSDRIRYDVAWYGDSITHVLGELRDTPWWSKVVYDPFFAPGARVGLFGVPGNDVEDLTWRLVSGAERLALDPKVLLLWVGTNNLGQGTSPVDKLDFLLPWLRAAHPTSTLAFLNILPCARYETAPTNRAIRKVCAKHGVAFLDCGSDIDPSNVRHMPDGLHPSPAGYQVVMRCLSAWLSAWLSAQDRSSAATRAKGSI